MKKKMAKILVVDDEVHTLEGLSELLTDEGYDIESAISAEEALQKLSKNCIDLLLTDLMLPSLDGLELYLKAKEIDPKITAVIMTAYGSVKSAVSAMREGVYDYVTKPIDFDELLITIKKALDERELKEENIILRDQVDKKYGFENIIGKSGPMQEIFKRIMKVAPTNSTVMIRGESGTGKELIAGALHYKSKRRTKPLIEINCSSFPDSLLESELFGYERGAFTGAYKTKKGRMELSDSGTIFLDEIGDISPAIQVKLLKVLQDKVITRLGSTKNIDIDVRVIAATNTDLEKAIKEGRFREDLYYRLNVITIVVPPLRERKSDIPLLIDHFIEKYSKENNRKIDGITKEALDICLDFHWPGNVRELENAIENAVVMSEGTSITEKDLPSYLHATSLVPSIEINDIELNGNFDSQMHQAERLIFERALKEAGGNRTKAAEKLGISLRTMRYKVRKYNL